MNRRGMKRRGRPVARLESLEARQLLISTGPDGFGYEASDHAFQSIDLVAGAAGVASVVDGVDDGTGSIPLGANTFRFYGTTYSGSGQLHVSSNGLITFTSGNAAYNNTDLTTIPAERAIAPLWDDWQTNAGTGSAVLYKFEDTSGDSTPDRLIIEWNDVPNFNTGTTLGATFQAILQVNNASGQSEIILNYPDLDVGNASYNNGASATVGIKDVGTQGDNRLLISKDTGASPFVATGKAIRIIQNTNYGTVAGHAFNDINANGVKDSGETGLTNWTLYLDANNNAALDSGETTTTTNALGDYKFIGLLPGTYRVRQFVPSGFQATAPATGVHVVNVSAGQDLTGLQFGARALPGEIRGTKWNDVNGNRLRDAGEPGLSGWTIFLDNNRNNALDAGEPSTLTNANGDYAFTNLVPGLYVVAEVQQAGWEQTFPGGAALVGNAVAQEPAADDAEEDEAVKAALARASDLSQYTKDEIASATQWVVRLKPGRNVNDVAGRVGSQRSARAPQLANTYVLEFANGVGGWNAANRLNAQKADVELFYPLIVRQQQPRAFTSNDPLFSGQWHLKNTGQTGGTINADANVQPAWNGDITGDLNTVIGIVDDGLQHTHPDLTANYLPAYSFDFNFNDSDPSPSSSNPHGTAVAGVAAGRGGNGVGVTGAAPLAGLAGLRLIADLTTDSQEANALSYQKANIDIYSNSWGPRDNGFTLEAPGPLTLAAFADSVNTGRGGLGSIYTWAAGNGLGTNDNVNYDGYANSRYTIAVSAIDHNGRQSWYSEPGAPILVAAYSDSPGITTTDLMGSAGYNGLADTNYTNGFGGTSSATPLVSGVIALMLDANPNLTWRDVQHILVRTARKNDAADLGWRVNGGGHDVSHKYGFGAIDAGAAVAMAQTWQTVSSEISTTSGVINVNTAIPDNNTTGISSNAIINEAIRIESVEVVLSATHTARGNLRIVLTSPSGTQSILAETHSDTGDNYSNWVFTSTQHWDEVSPGTWTLQVTDQAGTNVGTFNNWKLNIYGTQGNNTVHYVTVGNGQVVTGKDFGNRNTAANGSIAGLVFNDANANGIQDGADAGLSNVTVYVDANGSGTFNAGETTAVTGTGGTYAFSGLSAGNYMVRMINPAGRRQSFPLNNAGHNVSLTSGQNVTGRNFGSTTLAQVSGFVFNDLNGDGIKQTNEAGLSGWRLYLDNNNNAVWDSATEPSILSGTGGAYTVNLPAGTYRGRIVVQAGWQQTAPVGGAYAGTLPSGQKVAGLNFGVRQLAQTASLNTARIDSPLTSPKRSLWSELEIA